MKPRHLLPLLGLILLGAIGLTLALVVQPWEKAEPQPVLAEYGLCNVSLGVVPQEIKVSAFPFPDVLDETEPRAQNKLYLLLEAPRAKVVTSITDPKNRSYVGIDATSGEIDDQFYRTSADRELLEQALSTLHVGPWELAEPEKEFELLPSWGC